MVRLSQTLLREIGAIARSVQSSSDLKYKTMGLQKGQYVFLTRICENPGVGPNRLAELARVDKTTATKAAQKLVDLGYVRRELDREDGRARLLFPTAKAGRIYQALIADENELLEACLSGFGASEVTLATTLLQRIRDNLDSSLGRGEARA
jgi:DNA-binding MarR family transcriptional regulator